MEPTSGNTGIALAMICRRKGYPFRAVMPDNVTEERTQLLRMYGAEIVYSEGAKGSNGAVEMALDMAERDASLYMPYQYGNDANPDAHYNGTAVEILEELDSVAAFVGGLGTGGTLMGNGRRLKEHDPETKIVAAEPMQGELVSGLRSLDDGFIPPIIDLSVLDRKIMVSNENAIRWTQRLLARGGPVRRRLRRRDRLRRPPDRRRARRRQRRLPRSRRRLEVPLLRRLHEALRGARERRLHRLVVAGRAPQTRPAGALSRPGSGTLPPMQIDTAVLEEIAAHAREDLPNECCGMIGGRDGRATSALSGAQRLRESASLPGRRPRPVPDRRARDPRRR